MFFHDLQPLKDDLQWRNGFLFLHCHTVFSERLHNSSFKKDVFVGASSSQELTVGGFLLSRDSEFEY